MVSSFKFNTLDPLLSVGPNARMKVLYYIMILSLILLLNGNCAAVDAAAVASIWTSDNGSLCLGSASDTVLLSGVPVLAEINILKDLVIPKCIVDSPARLFKQISRLQQPVLNGTGSDRYFGAAVAISGTVVAVGAYAANSGSGAVYIFDTGCADVERQHLPSAAKSDLALLLPCLTSTSWSELGSQSNTLELPLCSKRIESDFLSWSKSYGQQALQCKTDSAVLLLSVASSSL
jgi:hypothetical protein